MIFAFFPSWFGHPLASQVCHATYHTAAQVRDCLSYNWWSGIASDIGEITLITTGLTALFLLYRRHNCHIHHCPRLQWHVDPSTGHPVCKKHHPDHPKGGGGMAELGHPMNLITEMIPISAQNGSKNGGNQPETPEKPSTSTQDQPK